MYIIEVPYIQTGAHQKDAIYYIHFREKRFFFVLTYVKNVVVKLHVSRLGLN